MLARKKQRVLLKFLFIPLAVILSIPFSLLLPPSETYAATNGSTLNDPDQVTSWLYYQAVMQCLNTGANLETNGSKISSNQLFSSKGAAPALPYLRSELTGVGPDQLTNCDETNSQLSTKAFNFWKISAVDFLCSLNESGKPVQVSRNDGRSCTQGDSDFTYFNNSSGTSANDPNTNTNIANSFKSYLKEKVYNGETLFSVQSVGSGQAVEGALTDAQKYYFYNTSLFKACIVKNDGTMPTKYDKKQDGAGVYTVKSMEVKNEILTLVTSYYIGPKNIDDTVSVSPNGFNESPNNYSLTCGDLQNKSNDAIAAAITQITTGASRDACLAIPYVGPELSACILGAANKDKDEAWCESRNWSLIDTGAESTRDRLIAACKAGFVTNVNLPSGEDKCTDASCNNLSTSCVVEGIGWIVCPILNFLAGVTDATYKVVEGLLVTNVDLVNTDSGTYTAWSTMRTLANVGFVIVFLVIIFSQLTSIGVSNYGVKKLLPRIIVAAILVNTSFIVSQLAVDISNILGGSLKSVLDNIAIFDGSKANDVLAAGNAFTNLTLSILGGGSLIAVGVVAGVAAYYAGLGLLIPIILAAVLAIIVTLFILVARQALVVILVVVSPLAFLAMLLPNTETYFKQWRKIFIALLLIYPAVALLFGGSHLAASILLNSFGSEQKTLGTLVALAVMVLPLFVLPSILKGSLNAVPAIGNFASKVSSRANGLVGKQSKQGFAKSTFGRSLAIRRQAKDNYRAKRFAEGASQQGSMANKLSKGLNFTKSQQFANQAVERNAISSADKADSEDVSSAEVLLRSQHSNPTSLISEAGNEYKKAVASGDTVRARAAQNVLLTSGGKGVEKLHESIAESFGPSGQSKNSEVGQSLRTALNRAGLKTKNNAVASWAYNDSSFGETVAEKSTFGSLSDAELGGHSAKNLQAAKDLGVLTKERAERMLANDAVSAGMGDAEREVMKSIVNAPPVDNA